MVWDDFSVEINGFQLNDLNQGSVASFTNIFRDLTPSGSYVVLSISKTPVAYDASLKVVSSGERFLIDASRFSVHRTLQALLEALEKKMKHWHQLQNLRLDYV